MSSVGVGTVQGSVDGGAGIVLRWTVDDFLRRVQQGYYLTSPRFRFRSATFRLSVYRRSSELHLRWPIYRGRLPFPFSWKVSVESGDGTILKCAADVEEEEKNVISCGNFVNIGFHQDIEELLHPDGSLVIKLELRTILEETATNPSSQSLQHPDAVDGTGESGLTETLEGECDAVGKKLARRKVHLSTRTFGTLQQDVGCTRATLIVPNFRELADLETLNICSERFHFGSRLWKLRLSPRSHRVLEDHMEGEVLLSLEEVGGCQTTRPFSWKLWAEDGDGEILRSSGGVCGDANGTHDLLTLPLGPLRNAGQFLDSKGVLRVTCELRLQVTDNGGGTAPRSELWTIGSREVNVLCALCFLYLLYSLCSGLWRLL